MIPDFASALLWATLLAIVGVALFNAFWNWMWGMQDDQVDAMRYAMDAAQYVNRPRLPREEQAEVQVRNFTRDTNPNVQLWVDAYLNTPEGRQVLADTAMQMMGHMEPVTEQPVPAQIAHADARIDEVMDGVRQMRQDYVAQQQAYMADYAAAQQQAYANAYQNAWANPPHQIYPTRIDPEVEARLRAKQEREAEDLRQAQERARGLLKEKLTPEQWSDWETTRSFVVTSQSGKQYRLGDGRAFNVTLLNSPVRQTYCAIPTGSYSFPIEDQLLAQTLWLQVDEQQFLDTANWYPQRLGRSNDIGFLGDYEGPLRWEPVPEYAAPQGQTNRQIRRAMAPICRELNCTITVIEDIRQRGCDVTHTYDGQSYESFFPYTIEARNTNGALQGALTNIARQAHGRTR